MIRVLRKTDIAGLNNLPPRNWDFDYEGFINEFFTADYFYAFIIIHDEKIIGTGNVLIKGSIGWLANIMVCKKYRGKGLGFKMTEFLVGFLKSKGCETQVLIATELGEPVYNKAGFRKITEYRCFHSEKKKEIVLVNSIRKLEQSDLVNVYKLDKEVNDEDRAHLIDRYYKTGLVIINNAGELLGFYLPDFGRGLIISKNDNAGIELLKVKHSQKGQKTLLPIENQAGINFLKNSGLKEGMRCSRMILGKELEWKPKYIYSYAGGHCG